MLNMDFFSFLNINVKFGRLDNKDSTEWPKQTWEKRSSDNPGRSSGFVDNKTNTLFSNPPERKIPDHT